MNEFQLIRKYFARPAQRALLGAGDDCALLPPTAAGHELAVTADLLLEGRHFRAGVEPRSLGHKSLAVNLSDLAAMGATPRWALLALALPAADEAWLAAFAAGFFALAERHGVELVGGDTTRGPVLTICVTAAGELPSGGALRRDGARPGDDLWTSGELGGAAAARAGDASQAKRLDWPQPRVELGQRLRGLASAAIDVSDGLAGDLAHILERSQVGAVVHYDRIPRPKGASADCVLSGGDDYELLFTAAPGHRGAIAALAPDAAVIGTIDAQAQNLRVLDAAGKPMAVKGGFDHFA